MPRSALQRTLWATLAMALAASAAPSRAADWRPFANPRFGFSLDVPAAFRAAPPPENGDGRRFTSPDGSTEITAYGHYLASPGDLGEEARAAESDERANGLAISYRDIRANRYALSGTAGGRIVYILAVFSCGRDAVATVRITYPTAAKAKLDPIVGHVAASLRGSGRCA